MLDHVFTDAIGALRDTFENALLERQAFEERFQADVLLGDLTWETSYGLPGEGSTRESERTSRSTGPHGPKPRTGRGTSANPSKKVLASRSRSCCACNGCRSRRT